MRDNPELLAAIRSNPSDENLRLAYAVWQIDDAEDADNPDDPARHRGEFIRAQLSAAQGDPEADRRARELFSLRARDWCPVPWLCVRVRRDDPDPTLSLDLPGGGGTVHLVYRLGFVARVVASRQDTLDRVRPLLASEPVAEWVVDKKLGT